MSRYLTVSMLGIIVLSNFSACSKQNSTASTSGSVLSSDIAQLRAENDVLRDQLGKEAGNQMRKIVTVGVKYAEVHGRFPVRSSELRELVGDDHWNMFIAPYDRPVLEAEQFASMDERWNWIDEHGSFQWHQGQLYDHHTPVLIERRGALGQPLWVFFGDAHGEQIAQGGAAWQRLKLPVS